MENKEKLKNIKDLEYNRLLNLENILLAFIGAAIISVILIKPEDLPIQLQDIGKAQMLFYLALLIFIVFAFINAKLKQVTDEIKKL